MSGNWRDGKQKPRRSKYRAGLSAEIFWWPGAESNHRHKDFQSSALPTELPGQRSPPLYTKCRDRWRRTRRHPQKTQQKTQREGWVFCGNRSPECFWWPGAESNHRHKDFQSSALPTELPGQRSPQLYTIFRACASRVRVVPLFSAQHGFAARALPQTVGFTARKGVNWRQSGAEVAWG